MICPRCNSVNSDNDRFCHQCGYLINNDISQNIPNNVNTNQTGNMNMQDQVVFQNQNTQNAFSQTDPNIINDDNLIRAYIGNNADKIINNSFSIGTFFLGIIYLCYRKLWLLSLVLFGVTTALRFFLNGKLVTILTFVIGISLSFSFRKIYLNHVNNKVKKIKQSAPGASQYELEEICRKKGGTSLVLAIILAIIMVCIPYLIVIITVTTNVTNTVNTAKTNSLKNNIDRIANWFDNQYAIYYYLGKEKEDYSGREEIFTKTCVENNCISENGLTASYLSEEIFEKLGIEKSNIVTKNNRSFSIMSSEKTSLVSYVSINSTTMRSCVKIATEGRGIYPSQKIICSGGCSLNQCVSTIDD